MGGCPTWNHIVCAPKVPSLNNVEVRSKSLHAKRVPMRLSVFYDDGVEQQPPTFEVTTTKSRGGGDLGGGGGGLGEGRGG